MRNHRLLSKRKNFFILIIVIAGFSLLFLCAKYILGEDTAAFHLKAFTRNWGITFPDNCQEIFYAADLGFQGDGLRYIILEVESPSRVSLVRFSDSAPDNLATRASLSITYQSGIAPISPPDKAAIDLITLFYEKMSIPNSYQMMPQGAFRWEVLENEIGDQLLLINPQQSNWYYLYYLRI